MNIAEVRDAISEARRTLEAADSMAGSMAMLLQGRLRKVPAYVLQTLKRELQQFNCHTAKWKDGTHE